MCELRLRPQPRSPSAGWPIALARALGPVRTVRSLAAKGTPARSERAAPQAAPYGAPYGEGA